ncbi:tripartite tricarboxylate transporter TctB family protein [Psychrobacillus antarcticus]|uniref:tripartite tricarboxylate transporter TctB family protein n=1 Tax=Psychrobacillus antarcticus TaxID=2879115 RepID=UPI0024087430|nr:tripartite tricarboxylate transporter TctB family protein [Psychrobacillus antarcticus]
MKATTDRGFACVFLVIGLAFIVGSRSYVSTSYGSQVGSNVFPTMLGVLTIILSIKLFIETFRYEKENKAEKVDFDYKKFFIILVATFAYCLLLRPLGYVITTFLFLLIGFQTIQRGKTWISVLIALIISISVYYIFVKLLNGTLPKSPVWLDFLN